MKSQPHGLLRASLALFAALKILCDAHALRFSCIEYLRRTGLVVVLPL